MKKSVAILLLSVLLIPVAALSVYTIYLGYNSGLFMSSSRFENFDRSEVIEKTFNRAETSNKLNWLNEREFIEFGTVFRVVKVKYSGSNIIYYCLKDENKTAASRTCKTVLEKTSEDSSIAHSFNILIQTYFSTIFSLPEEATCYWELNQTVFVRLNKKAYQTTAFICDIEHPPKIF